MGRVTPRSAAISDRLVRRGPRRSMLRIAASMMRFRASASSAGGVPRHPYDGTPIGNLIHATLCLVIAAMCVAAAADRDVTVVAFAAC